VNSGAYTLFSTTTFDGSDPLRDERRPSTISDRCDARPRRPSRARLQSEQIWLSAASGSRLPAMTDEAKLGELRRRD